MAKSKEPRFFKRKFKLEQLEQKEKYDSRIKRADDRGEHIGKRSHKTKRLEIELMLVDYFHKKRRFFVDSARVGTPNTNWIVIDAVYFHEEFICKSTLHQLFMEFDRSYESSKAFIVITNADKFPINMKLINGERKAIDSAEAAKNFLKENILQNLYFTSEVYPVALSKPTGRGIATLLNATIKQMVQNECETKEEKTYKL